MPAGGREREGFTEEVTSELGFGGFFLKTEFCSVSPGWPQTCNPPALASQCWDCWCWPSCLVVGKF